MKISDFFQKGYYINLDIRTERKTRFLNEMKNVGLENFFERFPAFYYKDGDYPYRHPHHACTRSHMTVIKKAYDEGYERVLILEDDVYFYENGLESIEKSLDQLQKINDWDLMYLGSMILDPNLNFVDENLLKQDVLLTAHAIGYSRKGLEKVIRFNWDNGAALDGWYGGNTNLNKYVTYPLGLLQIYGHSDINDFGQSAPPNDYIRGYKLPKK